MKISIAILLNQDINKEKTTIRFFAAGVINSDDTFTGIVHDCLGDDRYGERLMVKDRWIIDNGELDWDEQVKVFNAIAPLTLDGIESKLFEYMHFDGEEENYVLDSDVSGKFGEDGILFLNMNKEDAPYGFGVKQVIDGYNIDETLSFEDIEKELRINFFIKTLEKADLVTIGDSPFLYTWDNMILDDEEEDEIIGVSWNSDGLEYEYHLKRDWIEDIGINDHGFLVSVQSEKFPVDIRAYETTSLSKGFENPLSPIPF